MDDTVDVDDEAVAGIFDGCRPDWTFDDAACERIVTYRLTCRIDGMACLPLWLEDPTPVERDERARQHRAFVEDYLES
jgi:hypothetical protein